MAELHDDRGCIDDEEGITVKAWYLKNEELAELHAIIQAIEYERRNAVPGPVADFSALARKLVQVGARQARERIPCDWQGGLRELALACSRFVLAET